MNFVHEQKCLFGFNRTLFVRTNTPSEDHWIAKYGEDIVDDPNDLVIEFVLDGFDHKQSLIVKSLFPEKIKNETGEYD